MLKLVIRDIIIRKHFSRKGRELPLNQAILVASAEHTAHAGHSHSFLGGIAEKVLSQMNMSDNLRECLTHIITDSINVFFLLIAVMLIVFLATSYVNLSKLQEKLASLRSVVGFLLAILLGVLSPFCSCSIIPVLMGFLSVGVPMSVCLCFLTASSMLNITAIISLYSIMGPTFTLYYLIIALIIIIVSTIVFVLLKLEHTVGEYHSHEHHDEVEAVTFSQKMYSAWQCTLNVLKRSWIFILVGIVLSAIIMSYLPIEQFAEVVEENSVVSTLIVSLIGIPIHSEIFSIAPILQLFSSISRQLAIAFVISTMAISVPTIVVMFRVVKAKTVLIYCGTIISLALILSLVFPV